MKNFTVCVDFQFPLFVGHRFDGKDGQRKARLLIDSLTDLACEANDPALVRYFPQVAGDSVTWNLWVGRKGHSVRISWVVRTYSGRKQAAKREARYLDSDGLAKQESAIRAKRVERMAQFVADNVPHNGLEYNYNEMEDFLKSLSDTREGETDYGLTAICN